MTVQDDWGEVGSESKTLEVPKQKHYAPETQSHLRKIRGSGRIIYNDGKGNYSKRAMTRGIGRWKKSEEEKR